MPLLPFLARYSPNEQGLQHKLPPTKTSLDAQLDDLAAEKFELKAKADGLVDEVARLKAESTKA
jgi:hypothetical protein